MKQQRKQAGITVFYSYASADSQWRDRLAAHLSQLRRDGLIEEWSDQQILAGADRSQEIDQAIHSAKLILLLISADFLASDVQYHGEMQQALERHKRGEARVIPVIVQPCDWQYSSFAHLQCLPRNKKPVTLWDNQDEAFELIVRDIRAVVEVLGQWVVIVSPPPHQPLLMRLVHDLEVRRLPLWIQDGTKDLKDMQEAIHRSSSVILLASPETYSSPLFPKVLEWTTIRGHQTVALWVIEDQHAPLPALLHGTPHIDVPPEGYDRALRELLLHLSRRLSILTSLAEPSTDLPRNPYKGLRPFGSADQNDFFGRENYCTRLLEHAQQSVFTAVIGASGSRKSSLVQAGLLPLLPNSWRVLSLYPGSQPVHALTSQLMSLVPLEARLHIARKVEQQILQGSDGLIPIRHL